MSDHTLTLISTWAEVAILLLMVWEKYSPNFGATAMRGETTIPQRRRTGSWIWNNRTLILAILGLVFIGWLNLGRSPLVSDHDALKQQLASAQARIVSLQSQLSITKETVAHWETLPQYPRFIGPVSLFNSISAAGALWKILPSNTAILLTSDDKNNRYVELDVQTILGEG